MSRIVAKFGGTSVADLDRIRAAAATVKSEVGRGNQVAVVVSAMAGVTNDLVGLTSEANPMHDAREYDAVVATGEQVTSGLLALCLQQMGVSARSWQGWQIPIHTDDVHGRARILDVETDELERRLDDQQVCVVAGFQGLGPDTASPHWAAAVPTPPRLPSPPRCRRNGAIFIPMSMVSTRRTRAS